MTVLASMPWRPPYDVTLDGEVILHSVLTPASAAAGLQINSSGIMQKQEGGGFVTIDSPDWLGSGGVGADFECRLVQNSGDVPTGSAIGTWLNLGTTRTWQYSQSGVGTKTGQFSLQIRPAGGTYRLATATYNMTATVDI